MTDAKRVEAVLEALRDARDELEDIIAARQSEFEARSERWQEGDAGQAHSDRTSYLETAHAEVESAVSTLEDTPA